MTAGAGFLLAVLWFDLMFDVQVIGRGPREKATDPSPTAGFGRPLNRVVGQGRHILNRRRTGNAYHAATSTIA